MSDAQTPYRVLARKYRPQNFDDLIGQDALVRTLKNAIESGRIAHAFMLTGIRGVGKTTTARIIAKALNYTGADGKAGPTPGRTDDCEICKAIAEDRHPDVMEMDAASRTGVDDIREILDGVRYAPTSARYKIYIIDEVHMLSKNAFNALLKTLEEPPAHVKFIFATTEIRKVPVTVLSRCQRFDLRRIDAATLGAYYKTICDKEKAKTDDDALALIARAADGSVRDGLSLLDQAISLGSGDVTAQQVKDMLGLADRATVLDLLEHAVSGRAAQALDILEDLYRKGADPAVILQDMLDLTHLLTRMRVVPKMQDAQGAMAREEQERAASLAAKLSMPSLGRAWQILLKGLGEIVYAPNAQKAAEMIVIRLSYASDLPDPADLIRKLKDQTAMPVGNGNGGGSYASVPSGGGAQAALAVRAEPETVPQASLRTLEDAVALLDAHDEIKLSSQVYQFVHLVKMEQGRLEIRLEPEAPPRLSQDLGSALTRLSGARWLISVTSASGAPTLAQTARAAQEEQYAGIMNQPLVKQVFDVFPDAKIISIRRDKEST